MSSWLPDIAVYVEARKFDELAVKYPERMPALVVEVLSPTDRMNKIREINIDDLYAICQPGLTTFELQQAVEKQGLMFAPDPASCSRT